jgi:hypothetical protein
LSDRFHTKSTNASASSDGTQCEKILNVDALQNVRSVTFSLLDLEMKSYKWYKDRALGYFIDMEQKISQSCGLVISRNIQKCIRSYVYSPESDLSDVSVADVVAMIKFLQGEVDRLSTDLYSLSSNTSVPQAFLNCDPEKKHEAKYSLEDDGFEIL